MGDGWLAESDGLGHVTDARLALGCRGDHREQLDPRGVAERLEGAREGLGGAVADDACCHR